MDTHLSFTNGSVGRSACLTQQFVREAALLQFAPYVRAHICEDAWLAWLLVQHVADVVVLHQHMQHLLHEVHASAAASALLLHALNTRGCQHLQVSHRNSKGRTNNNLPHFFFYV